MATQMHSLREQSETLKRYTEFCEDRERFDVWEAIGALAFGFCVGFTVLSFVIPGG